MIQSRTDSNSPAKNQNPTIINCPPSNQNTNQIQSSNTSYPRAIGLKTIERSPTPFMRPPSISSLYILISQPTQTDPPPRMPRIPLPRSRSSRARTPIRLIFLPIPIRLIIILLLLRDFRSITSSRARRRIVARPAAPTRRALVPSPPSIFAGLLREDFLFFFLASFFGRFLGFLFALFFFFLGFLFFCFLFGCFLSVFDSVFTDLFVVVCRLISFCRV
jgi:hypothetical protein